ncbi:MAG: U32 family peptidase [Clostridia bacterium]|nr:U32 family peptidase [Clostridia bacterium]MBR6554419.1 U32 family peptidase [Clostridia bacterium]
MTDRKKPEILSPAGNPEKFRFAIDYGADAVYCALERFGMRRAADNFTKETLASAIDYAHARGRKVYLTVNVMPHEGEFDQLPRFIAEADELKPDAYIVSDPGVMDCIKANAKNPELHLSTQASTVNAAACRFWYRQGVKRIVLARELSLAEIKAIRGSIPEDLELEAFVHGAMCVSYSGRCLLSNYFAGRDANGGACAQPCRWKYYVHEEKRPEDVISAEQDEYGTYLFSSKDLCMVEHIGALAEAGLDSLKIEGRVKSAYYTAAVTNAYRMALDDYYAGKPFNPAYRAEVESVSHREYATGYFYGNPHENANIVGNNIYLKDRAFLAVVKDYDETTGLALCEQFNKMQIGDKANLLSPGTTGRDITVEALFDKNGQPISDTKHPRMEFYLKIENARAGDLIRGI